MTPSPSPHQSRVAHNEAAFRAINAEIADDTTHHRVGFLCECGHATCRRIVELGVAEYREVRADPRHFFVLPGHEIPSAERVVTRVEDSYLVVEKGPEVDHIVLDDQPVS